MGGRKSDRQRFEDFERPERNATGYSFDNEYFGSPDAEVLYSLIRMHRPKRVIEIGFKGPQVTRAPRLRIIDAIARPLAEPVACGGI